MEVPADVNPSAVASRVRCVNLGRVRGRQVVYNLLDGHTVAVDAVNGRELWKTQIADIGQARRRRWRVRRRQSVIVGP